MKVRMLGVSISELRWEMIACVIMLVIGCENLYIFAVTHS